MFQCSIINSFKQTWKSLSYHIIHHGGSGGMSQALDVHMFQCSIINSFKQTWKSLSYHIIHQIEK